MIRNIRVTCNCSEYYGRLSFCHWSQFISVELQYFMLIIVCIQASNKTYFTGDILKISFPQQNKLTFCCISSRFLGPILHFERNTMTVWQNKNMLRNEWRTKSRSIIIRIHKDKHFIYMHNFFSWFLTWTEIVSILHKKYERKIQITNKGVYLLQYIG